MEGIGERESDGWHLFGTKKYTNGPRRAVPGRPRAPTSSRFITVRFWTSGTKSRPVPCGPVGEPPPTRPAAPAALTTMRCGCGAGDRSDCGLKPATLPKDATDGRMLVVCIMMLAIGSECWCPQKMGRKIPDRLVLCPAFPSALCLEKRVHAHAYDSADIVASPRASYIRREASHLRLSFG